MLPFFGLEDEHLRVVRNGFVAPTPVHVDVAESGSFEVSGDLLGGAEVQNAGVDGFASVLEHIVRVEHHAAVVHLGDVEPLAEAAGWGFSLCVGLGPGPMCPRPGCGIPTFEADDSVGLKASARELSTHG